MKTKEYEELLQTLQARFEKNLHRYIGRIAWANVQAKIEGNPAALSSLQKMEH